MPTPVPVELYLLLRTNPSEEMDCSGKGQHTDFEVVEEPDLSFFLLSISRALCHSASALVKSLVGVDLIAMQTGHRQTPDTLSLKKVTLYL